MADKAFSPDELKKKIETLKAQLKGQKDPKSPEARKVRKQLKRAQRRLTLVTPRTLEQKLAGLTRQNDIIGKIVSELSKATKKPQNDPHIHSLRKKTKSLNKRVKKVNRLIAKKAPAAPAAAPAQ